MQNLLNFDDLSLADYFTARGEKPYRAKQVLRRLHTGAADVFVDLPKPLRTKLAAEFYVAEPSLVSRQTAADGVQKLLFEVSPKFNNAHGDGRINDGGRINGDGQFLADEHFVGEQKSDGEQFSDQQFSADNSGGEQFSVQNSAPKIVDKTPAGERIETVLIPEARRQTLCVSSQVGCALACRFCLTGKQGLSRNLTTAEIIAQLRTANRLSPADKKITNVVMMGMGEPLLNLDSVLPALRLMTTEYLLPPRRITVSTAGIVPAMARLRDAANVSLAVSLHAAADSLRDEIMPINKKYPLAQLLSACRLYIQNKRRAYLTFEYVMLEGVNDSAPCARDLIRRLHGVRCKVNLIPFNTFDGAPYTASSPQTILHFRDLLMRAGLMTTIRKTRGDDILAACGQLAGQLKKTKRGLLTTESPLLRQ